MLEPQRDRDIDRAWTMSPWTAIWNAVLPALAVVLMLGASVVSALAIAAVVSLVIMGVFRGRIARRSLTLVGGR